MAVQIASAILLGLGYGLVYTFIQTPGRQRRAAPNIAMRRCTWFVIAYFIGIFGFPVLGGWLIVTMRDGKFPGRGAGLSRWPKWRSLCCAAAVP